MEWSVLLLPGILRHCCIKMLLSVAQSDKEPTLYAEFQLIWKVRVIHMVCGLPSYVFFLLCYYHDGWPHPRCQAGPPQNTLTWYPGGPPLYQLPLPVPDPERRSTCSSCKSQATIKLCLWMFVTAVLSLTYQSHHQQC